MSIQDVAAGVSIAATIVKGAKQMLFKKISAEEILRQQKAAQRDQLVKNFQSGLATGTGMAVASIASTMIIRTVDAVFSKITDSNKNRHFNEEN